MAAIVVAFALALYDQTQYARGHVEHPLQIVVVVDGQQVAVLVRVADVELDAVEAVQTLHKLIKLVKLVQTLAVKSESTKLGVILFFLNKTIY